VRITFLVPDFVSVPVGGIKVAYEFANRLADRGHDVAVLHIDTLAPDSRSVRVRRNARFTAWRLGIGGWLRLRRGIRTGLVDPRHPRLPSADRIVAVGWKSVGLVAAAPDGSGRKVYFAMDYMADYEGKLGEVDAAWQMPMSKIVAARWLLTKAVELCGEGVDATLVPLGVGGEFQPRIDPAERNPLSLALYYNPAPVKGFAECLEALELVRRRHPIRAVAFGGIRPVIALPDWIDFRLGARELAPVYNSAATFVHSSRHEGFGLPPAEAMASGCALAAFANVGVSEYAVDESNALLVSVGDIAGLASATMRLIEDDALRIRLARQGIADLSARTWERSVSAMEEALAAIP
jgi:glycosyltransferase involved in cell wall biosynthesis